MQVLDAMEPEWTKRLEGAGSKPAVAEPLAEHIRRILGNPVPDPPAQAEEPNEQGKGQFGVDAEQLVSESSQSERQLFALTSHVSELL